MVDALRCHAAQAVAPQSAPAERSDATAEPLDICVFTTTLSFDRRARRPRLALRRVRYRQSFWAFCEARKMAAWIVSVLVTPRPISTLRFSNPALCSGVQHSTRRPRTKRCKRSSRCGYQIRRRCCTSYPRGIDLTHFGIPKRVIF